MSTVVLLAAGPGRRLGNKTKHFNKAFIRIGNQGAISHIIDYFPKHYKFVIVTGYLGDELEQYVKISHPNADCTFVRTKKYEGSGAGPGYALLETKEHVEGSFYIWTVDTLVKNFAVDEESNNWIGYAVAENGDGEYSCVEMDEEDNIRNFHEKHATQYTNNAYIGCAYIRDYQEFWKGMLQNPVLAENQYQVSAGFYELLKSKLPTKGKKLEWYDTGNLEKLQKTRKEFPAKIENLDKDDEEIYFFNDEYVVKYFKDATMAQNRVKRNKSLKNTVPAILRSSKNFYAYEYTNGKDFFNLDNPQDYFAELLTFAKDNLWEEKKLNPEEFRKFQETCVDFYYKKTKNRLDKLYEKIHLYDKKETIQGIKVPALNDILESVNWQKILNGKPTLMHGDFNFSNILLQDGGKFKFIDWRQDFGGMLEVGDMWYDLAKMYSGILLPHDVIKNEHYQIDIGYESVDLNLTLPNKYKECEKIFFDFLNSNNIDVNKVKQLAALVLLNMSPLHEFPLNIFLYYYGKYLLYTFV